MNVAAEPLRTPEGSAPIDTASIVFLTDGEQTAEALVHLGAGCVAWTDRTTELSPLTGKTVVIVPNNHGPGLTACKVLRERLTPIAADVKVWRVPGHFNDAAELLQEGGTLDDLTPWEETTAPTLSTDEPGSWAPLDIATIVHGLITGTTERTIPEILHRDDDHALLYPGKVNGIHGESGSGKTFTALYAAKQVIRAGGDVIYVDLEDSPIDVISRLLSLSVPPEKIIQHFRYVQPEIAFEAGADAFLRLAANARLVVIDSTGESLSMEGANPNADEDIAAWFRNVPKRIAKLGPAVLVLDHMPKSSDSDLWPIGSQRKRAAIDGAQYLQEVMVPFSREKAGAARLICAKDRHGTYARAQRVGILHVTPEGDTVTLALKAPEDGTEATGTFQPTVYMEKISRALEIAPGPLSYRGILERVEGKKDYLRRAVDELISDGYVTTTPGPRNSTEHTSVKPFRTGEHSAPQMAPKGSVTVPVPKEGERGTVPTAFPGNSRGTVGNSPQEPLGTNGNHSETEHNRSTQ